MLWGVCPEPAGTEVEWRRRGRSYTKFAKGGPGFQGQQSVGT